MFRSLIRINDRIKKRKVGFLVKMVLIFLVLLFIVDQCLDLFDRRSALKTRLKHVFYAHYMDTDDKLSVENLRYFMNFGYSPCDPDIFFTFIFNRKYMDTNLLDDLRALLGANIVQKMKACTCNDEDLTDSFARRRRRKGNLTPNTKIVVRLNDHGADLCAYSDMIRSEFWRRNEHLFFYYFFINSSARGPFLPNYYTNPWWTIFTNLLDQVIMNFCTNITIQFIIYLIRMKKQYLSVLTCLASFTRIFRAFLL